MGVFIPLSQRPCPVVPPVRGCQLQSAFWRPRTSLTTAPPPSSIPSSSSPLIQNMLIAFQQSQHLNVSRHQLEAWSSESCISIIWIEWGWEPRFKFMNRWISTPAVAWKLASLCHSSELYRRDVHVQQSIIVLSIRINSAIWSWKHMGTISKMRHLGVNLADYIQELYKKNEKLRREIEEVNTERDSPCSWTGRLNSVNVFSPPNLSCKLKAIPIHLVQTSHSMKLDNWL